MLSTSVENAKYMEKNSSASKSTLKRKSNDLTEPETKRCRITRKSAADDLSVELEIAQQLQNICVRVRPERNKWKEQNPKKSAKIFHQLGLVYKRRSPDKVCLLQSAGLLNAALVRDPTNKDEIQGDLLELHQLVLQLSGAHESEASLEDEAECVKRKLDNLRSAIRERLKQVEQVTNTSDEIAVKNKTEQMKSIQDHLSNEYRRIMAELGERCEKIKGEPPCKYAVVGMGSLSRNEITPYSDFEHAIVLEDHVKNDRDEKTLSSALEYFRWFSVIFHLIILSLQETIIPSLCVSSLNDKTQFSGDWFYDVTTQGVSFDGMMPHASKFPMGRQKHTKKKPFKTELIKPVQEMLEYLSEKEDLKNGYHLCDILSQTCYVLGDEATYASFAEGVRIYYQKKYSFKIREEVKILVEKDLKKFSVRRNIAKIKQSKKANVKTNVYRAISLFISALRKLFRVFESSTFDVIAELARRETISDYVSLKLRFAVAVACEMRLRSCLWPQYESKEMGFTHLLNIVGKPSALNTLQIAHCLQAKVAHLLDFEEIYEFTQAYSFNILLCFRLNLHQLVRKLFRNQVEPDDSDEPEWFDFDAFLRQMEDATQIPTTVTTRSRRNILSTDLTVETKRNAHNFYTLAEFYFDADFVEDANEFFHYALEINRNLSDGQRQDFQVGLCHYKIGLCSKELQKYSRSNQHFDKSLNIFSNLEEKFFKNFVKQNLIATVQTEIGLCLMELEKHNQAINKFNRALLMYKTLSANESFDEKVAAVIKHTGNCLLNQCKLRDAKNKFCLSRDIYSRLSLDDERDENIAELCSNIGHCHHNLEEYDWALKNFERSLKICRALEDIDKNKAQLASVLFRKGSSLTKLNFHHEAVAAFLESLELLENSYDDDDDDFKAEINQNIGECYLKTEEFEKARPHLLSASWTYKLNSQNSTKDKSLSDLLLNIGNCYLATQDYVAASEYFEQSLEITKAILGDDQKEKTHAETHRKLGTCLLHQNRFVEALEHLNRSYDIFLMLDSYSNKNEDLAETLAAIDKGIQGLKRREIERLSAQLD